MKKNTKIILGIIIFIIILITIGFFIFAKLHSNHNMNNMHSNHNMNNMHSNHNMHSNDKHSGEQRDCCGNLLNANELKNQNHVSIDFSLKDLKDATISSSDMKGKPYILSFFTTSCSYCPEEIKYLSELKKENKDLNIFLVNIGEDKKNVKKWIDSIKISNLNVLLDKSGNLSYNELMIQGTPTTIFVDKEGKIKTTLMGLQTYETLKKFV